MRTRVVASLGLLGMAVAKVGYESAFPGSDPSSGACRGSETCLGQPHLAKTNDDRSARSRRQTLASSLLQKKTTLHAEKAQTDTAKTGSGCPTWELAALNAIVSTAFNDKIQDYLPFYATHTFWNKGISHKECSARVNATAEIAINGDLQFQDLACTSARCLKKKWIFCHEYNPLNVIFTVGATSLSVEANLRGQAAFDASCKKDSEAFVDFDNVKAGFTVVNPKVEIAASLDFSLSPTPEVKSHDVTGVNFVHEKTDHFMCASDYCMDPESLLDTDEVKQAISSSIEHAFDFIRKFVG